MRSTLTGRSWFFRCLATAATVLLGVAGTALVTATEAAAATSVRVESQITAHDLPYLNSPYVGGSTLTAGQVASVECKTRGREYIGGSVGWYRINSVYYPDYAFAPPSTAIISCGVPNTVPLAANGYSSPTFGSAFAEHWFSSNEAVMALCTAAGQTHDGSDAWFFTKGYWLHSTRLKGEPTGAGYMTCRGFHRPGVTPRDDYPYRGQTSGVDPWSFYKGECTSFVAWRLNNRNNIDFHNHYRGEHFGNANSWDTAARNSGITVNGTPTVGAVGQSDAGTFGHVAWVQAVHTDGTVTVEEYNKGGTGAYSTRRVSASSFEYLHFPKA